MKPQLNFEAYKYSCSIILEPVDKAIRKRMARRGLTLLFAALLLAGWLGPSGAVMPTSAGYETELNRLVVMTYNVGGCLGKNKKVENRQDGIVRVIREPEPDLVLLQECGEKDWDRYAEALGLYHGRFIPYQGRGNSGLAILSRFPLREPLAGYFDPSPNGLGFMSCEMILPDCTVLVVNTHLDRIQRLQRKKRMPNVPWRTAVDVVVEEVFAKTLRTRQVERVLKRMPSRPSCPVIFAGDFNTIPFATAIRRVQSRFQDALWPSWDYFCNSYKDIGFPLKPRIDYIFHSPEILVADSGIVRSGIGDHYPVWAELVLHPHTR